DCILENKQPEFTPEDAKKGVAVVLLSYLSAKKRMTVTMEELMKIYKSEGTKTILEGLEDVVQRNYKSISWE
ncbi:MAG: hypothetical protein ACFFFB_23390, partial [Candidatus Heimdallarchaeota archaeon]